MLTFTEDPEGLWNREHTVAEWKLLETYFNPFSTPIFTLFQHFFHRGSFSLWWWQKVYNKTPENRK